MNAASKAIHEAESNTCLIYEEKRDEENRYEEKRDEEKL